MLLLNNHLISNAVTLTEIFKKLEKVFIVEAIIFPRD